ncbi:MAG: transcription termination/antitermination NusG family protein, partial [Bifidobacterium criceti]|nr:transcription termination/antitermination NusG family protein [Bifidobacterium criceti]
MSDEVNLDDLNLTDQGQDQSQTEEINAVAAASPSEDIAEGIAYDSVDAADDASAGDENEAATVSIEEGIDEEADAHSDAKSNGTADADVNNDGAEAQAEEEEEDAGTKAVKEFSKSLSTLDGKWYVLHTYSGYEKRVKSNIESRVASFGLEDTIFQVEVPMEEVEKHTEKGKKVVTRVRVPGYVLIRMWPDEDARRIVRE